MTDTTQVAKGIARRCSKCGLYRSHKQYRGALRATDDPRKPICDVCRDSEAAAEAAKSEQLAKVLDMPVVAYLPDGRTQETTIGKALGTDLAKQEQRALLANSMDNFGRLVKATRARWALEDHYELVQKRVSKLVRLGLARRATERANAETAEFQKQTAAANMAVETSKRRMALAEQEQADLGKRIEDMRSQIEAVYERAEAGARAVEQQEARRVAATLAREERDSDEWLYKANTTTDPVLRSAYLARADGIDPDEDDD